MDQLKDLHLLYYTLNSVKWDKVKIMMFYILRKLDFEQSCIFLTQTKTYTVSAYKIIAKGATYVLYVKLECCNSYLFIHNTHYKLTLPSHKHRKHSECHYMLPVHKNT